MSRDQLYLLKPDIMDNGTGPYFCPDCAEMTGLLGFYPALENALIVLFVGFPHPRPELAPLLGEENQGWPVLVLHPAISLRSSISPSKITAYQPNRDLPSRTAYAL